MKAHEGGDTRQLAYNEPTQETAMKAQEQFELEMEKASDRLHFIGIKLERYKRQHRSINWSHVGDIGNVNSYLCKALLFLAAREQL